MRAGGLAVVLLARDQPHLRPLHQTLPAKDTIDRRLRYREPHVVGDPRCQLTATQLRHLPCCRQNVVDFPRSKSVPWGLAASCMVLKPLLLLPSQPPAVCAPGDSQLTQRLPLGHGGRGYPGKYLRLLHSAHPLVPASAWGVGMAVFSDGTPPGTDLPPVA